MSVADAAVARRESSIAAVESSTITSATHELLAIESDDVSEADAEDMEAELQRSQLIDQQIEAINNATDRDLIERIATKAMAALSELGDDGSLIRAAKNVRLDAIGAMAKV